MIYETDKPLYLQIVDYACEQILLGIWKPEERVPSVRELSVTLTVNLNTVARSFDFLQDKQVLFQKRGIGYFVEKEGLKRIRDMYKIEFFQKDLPNLFKKMQKLNVSIEEIVLEYKKCST
ncbi:MAG: GntR family transcriptional regulator [Bacteroidales bacterium]|nr:GntR family transcriptional regulator [Bacteroidales bacterium]